MINLWDVTLVTCACAGGEGNPQSSVLASNGKTFRGLAKDAVDRDVSQDATSQDQGLGGFGPGWPPPRRR